MRLMCENENAVVTPLPGGSFIQKLTEIVGQAKYSVDVVQYQWVWYPRDHDNLLQKFNRGVVGVAGRGVKFRVILNIEASGHKITRENSHTQRILAEQKIHVKFGPQFPTTHSKIFIIDDQFVVIGSHNLSKRSVTVNYESSVLINSRAVAQEFKRYFETLWTSI